MTVDILFEDPRWQDIDLQRLAEVAKNATLRHLGYDAETVGLR
jgi:probable rRNA maturation factor